MKLEEAIDILKRMRIALATAKVDGMRVLEPLNIAIDATEKQIPKKPNCVEDKMWACPTCDNNLMWKWQRYPDVLIPKGFGNKFCLACGQAIDWSEDDAGQ